MRYSSYNEADSDTQHKHVRCDTKVILFVMIAAAPWAEVSNIRYHRLRRRRVWEEVLLETWERGSSGLGREEQIH